MHRKVIAIILCLVLTLSVLAVGCTKDAEKGDTDASFDETVSFIPLTAEGDDKLSNNPDRGYRTEFVFYVKRTLPAGQKPAARTVYVDQSEEQIREQIQSVFNIYIYNRAEQSKLALSYIYITDWREKELDDNILNFFKIYFTMCREQKIKNMLRVSYCTSTANLDEGADEKTIVRHTKQLKDVIAEYSDTIHTISCGFVGAYGEWASTYQRPSVDYATIIKAITENLAVPNNLFFSIRSPSYKNLVGKDYEHYWSISHNNDAMFGQQTKGWDSGGYSVGTPDWEQVTKEAAYTPQGGEMFVNGNLIKTERVPSGMEIILECYYHRHTSMSFWHGYLDAYKEDNVMKRWQNNEQVTPQSLSAEGVLFDPYWFVDDDGEAVERDPYQFIRDHLGYRIVATSSRVKGVFKTGEELSFEIKLKNYGFAAAFMLESGFAILDENYNVVSTVKAGEPDKWYSHDPENYKSTTVLEHSVSADIKLPEKSGKYYIAFYLKNTMNDYARLSNKMNFKNGYNILHYMVLK